MIQTVHCVDLLRGGVASVLFSYASACEDISFNFVSMAPVDEEARKCVDAVGGRVIADDIDSMGELRAALTAARKETGANIFHVHRNWHNLLPAKIAREVGYPIVISHSHNVFPSTSRLKDAYHAVFRRLIRRYVDECWGCSPEAIEFLYGRNPKNSLFLPNPISFSSFCFSPERRAAIRDALGLGDALTLIHSGLPIPQKNHRFLLRVFRGVLDANPDARLLLLGPDEENDEWLVREAELLGVRGSVKFCGYVDNVSDYYAAGDLFLFPSLNEGLSLALCEAQAEGLSFIASDRITSASDLFANGVFLPIDRGPDIWTECILSGDFKRKVPTMDQIESCPFNVEWCSPRLEATYAALQGGEAHSDILSIWGGVA